MSLAFGSIARGGIADPGKWVSISYVDVDTSVTQVDYVLTCDAGSYAYSGVAATLKVAHSLVCAVGSYSYSGVASTSLVVGHRLACDAGAYVYSGVASGTLKLTHSLLCDAGTYVYTGNAATLTYVAGSAQVDYVLTCDVGAYTYSGINSTLKVAHSLVCATGAYSYSGVATASLKVAHSLICDAGAYAYAGNAATFDYVGKVNYTLLCNAGSYSYSGNDATLDYTSTASTAASGGMWGWQRKTRRTPEELKAQRIALGILPPEVAAIANKIAQKAIKKATEQRQPDVLAWIDQQEQQALYERQLRMEMARHQQVWDAAYSRLIEIAVQEALQIEEESILMLMMEL